MARARYLLEHENQRLLRRRTQHIAVWLGVLEPIQEACATPRAIPPPLPAIHRRYPLASGYQRCSAGQVRHYRLEAFLLQAQFRWIGHVIRMPDSRIPKQVFFGQLASGSRFQGGPVQRYKDSVKKNLPACNIDPRELRRLPYD